MLRSSGTTYPTDRFAVAEALNFDGITRNSLDGVSDRDFCAEIAATLSILMMHLSRFSEGDRNVVVMGVQVHRARRQLFHRIQA